MPLVKIYNSDAQTKDRKPVTRIYRNKPYSFMRWWRVVRYWAKRNYGLTNEDIEIILHLYDRDLFTRQEFRNFEGLLAWDKLRWNRMLSDGLIVQWRDNKRFRRQAKLYTLSVRAKRICHSIYMKLIGEENISESRQNNKIFIKTQATYTDKVYRRAILAMNKERDRQKKEEEANKLKKATPW